MEKRISDRTRIRVWAENNTNHEVALWLGEEYVDLAHFKFCYTTRDISTTGLFLETRNPLPIGEILELEFSFPGVEKKMSIKGKIIRTQELGKKSDGMGLQFIDITPKMAELIALFVEQYNGSFNN